MIEKFHDLDEINKVKDIQKDCIKLNIIPPVLGLLKVKKFNSKEVIEVNNYKSNSYIRNAYNMILASLCGSQWATNIPMTYTYGGRGIKQENGAISNVNVFGSPPNARYVYVGSGNTPDTLDDFKLESKITTLTSTGETYSYDYDANTKTMSINMTNTFINTSASNIIVAECAVGGTSASGGPTLLVRDVFTPVQLSQFEGITITYTLQVIYP